MQVGRLVEDKSQDIFVIHYRCGALDNQLAVANHGCLVVTEVGVLPADPIIHFVHADSVPHDNWLTSTGSMNPIKVGDVAEAVTSQCQSVGGDAKARITQVKCLFAVIGRSWVTVWNCHLTHRNSVEERSSIIEHVIQNRSFADRPAHVE